MIGCDALILNANRELLMAAGSANPVETLRGGGKYRYSTGFGSNRCKQLFVLLVAVGGGAGSGK